MGYIHTSTQISGFNHWLGIFFIAQLIWHAIVVKINREPWLNSGNGRLSIFGCTAVKTAQ